MNHLEEALRRANREVVGPAVDLPADPLGQFAVSHEEPAAVAPVEIEPPALPEFVDTTEESSGTAPDPEMPEAASENPGDIVPVPRVSVNPALAGRLVIHTDIKSITVEQYRRLAATLHHAQIDNNTKVVMVASAVPGEGKTLTAVNLALTLSESYGRRVLLIDADFRRPSLHTVFQVPNVSGGLNASLKAETDRKLTILEVSPQLSLLPAGRPNADPMSGLTSGRMQRIINEAAAKFDWVILDTPPIGLITDAHLLAAMVDSAILVVKAGYTPFAVIQRAVESLGRDRVIGVVLNWVDERATSPGGKYGYYYSAEYGREPSKARKQVEGAGPRQ